MTGQVISGRYEIIAEMQDAGSRPLYTARDMSLTRNVAIRKCCDSEAMSINFLLRLNGSGVIHLYDVVAFEREILVVTPLFSGESMTSVLGRHKSNLVHLTRITLSVARIMSNIARLGWVITDLAMGDIYIDEESAPTITYAVFDRNIDDRRQCCVIGRMLHEIVATDRSQRDGLPNTGVRGTASNDMASRFIVKTIRDIADRALRTSESFGGYSSFEALIDELVDFCEHAPQQEMTAVSTTISEVAPTFAEEKVPFVATTRVDDRRISQPSLSIDSHVGSELVRERIRFQKPRRAYFFIAGGAIAAVLVVGIVLLLHNSSSNIVLPDLRGETIDGATTQLQSIGWRGTIVTKKQKVTDGTPSGIILSELPSAGHTIAQNGQVQLTVAAAGDGTNGGMNRLVGMKATEAYNQLLKQGVPAANITVQTASSSTAASGTVVGQTPSPSSSFVPSTTSVILTVAVGNGQALVPNVLGQQINKAGAEIVASGLHYYYVIDRSTGAAGAVVEQNPSPGAVEQRGAMVNMHVSNGKGT